MAQQKPQFGSSWASVTDVRTALTKARTNQQAQRRLLGSLQDKLDRRRTDLERSLAHLSAAKRTPIINKTLAGYRGELRTASADQRTAFVRQVAGIRDGMKSVAVHYRSPAQMLARQTLGSERRSRIQQQIANSGPAELASLAELAAATDDAEMAAALCSRIYDVEPSKRSFDAAALADKLVGDEFREVTQSLAEVERLTVEALGDDSTFERGKPSGQSKIKAALMKRNEERIGAEMPDALEDDNDIEGED